MKRTTVDRICKVCGNHFGAILSYIKRGDNIKYCSNKCKFKARIGREFSKEHIKNLVKSHLGIKMPPRTIEYRKKLAENRRGEKSHLWKGGITKENKRIRRSIEFRLWREAVFARDNWTCQNCQERGHELHPHHIKSFSKYPELRFAIDNGITLCKNCHIKTDNYGNKN